MADRTQTLVIANDTACLGAVRSLVEQGLRGSACPADLYNRVQLAVDEAVTNIIDHAYVGVPTGAGRIEICQTVASDRYQVIVEDNGLAFDPSKTRSDFDMAEHVRQGRSGGLGIFLMRRIMDVVDYSFEAGVCNRLLLIKYF